MILTFFFLLRKFKNKNYKFMKNSKKKLEKFYNLNKFFEI